MKLRHLLLTILMAIGLINASAQVHLRVSSLSRFPVAPTDTAYESLSYDSIQVLVENIGNTILNADNIILYILGNPASGPDILYDDTNAVYTAQAGSVTPINSFTYNLRPTHFDDGDNIVVVWPAARYTPHTSDSLTFHVYFVSLLAGIDKPVESPIMVAPNPINDYIVLDLPPEMASKQVRIIDHLGRTVFSLKEGQNYIPTDNWAPGMYLLQYTEKGGKQVTRRLIKN